MAQPKSKSQNLLVWSFSRLPGSTDLSPSIPSEPYFLPSGPYFLPFSVNFISTPCYWNYLLFFLLCPSSFLLTLFPHLPTEP